MTAVFLAILALAWIAVFLPAALRARRATPFTSAERFKRRMRLIAPPRSGGRWVLVPEPTDRLARASFRRGQARRRRILVFLIWAALSSGIAAAFVGGGLWEVHLALDLSLALFVVLLLEARRRRTERTTKVRPLAGRRAAMDFAFHEPVRASGGRRR